MSAESAETFDIVWLHFSTLYLDVVFLRVYSVMVLVM